MADAKKEAANAKMMAEEAMKAAKESSDKADTAVKKAEMAAEKAEMAAKKAAAASEKQRLLQRRQRRHLNCSRRSSLQYYSSVKRGVEINFLGPFFLNLRSRQECPFSLLSQHLISRC